MNRKPTKADLLAAKGKTVPDVIAMRLKILFCGINPGLYTAAIQCHFGRPGNRFWKVLYESGCTPRLFDPSEQYSLLDLGYGITNVVRRATAAASELSEEEFAEGGIQLRETVLHYKPAWLAVLGVGAYRQAFGQPKARVGKQDMTIGTTGVWVLPNPSGLNASYHISEMIALFRELRNAAE